MEVPDSPTLAVQKLLESEQATAPTIPDSHLSPGSSSAPDSTAATTTASTTSQKSITDSKDPSSSFYTAENKSAPAPTTSNSSTATNPNKPDPSLTSSSSSSVDPESSRLRRQTLQSTLHDLRSFLIPLYKLLLPVKSLDGLLRRIFGPVIRPILRMLARALWQRGLLASNLAFDIAITTWKLIINLFFREIRPRGAHNIPKEGPLIVVVAPHHNQFLDGIILMSEVQAACGRRLSILTAEYSMQRKFIGTSARLLKAIPVVRALDNAKPGEGTIYYDPDSEDFCTLYGYKTKFTKQLASKKQVMLPKSFGYKSVPVEKVVDDYTLILKKPFADKARDALVAAGRRIKNAATDEEKETVVGIEYKHMPHIDQTQMYSYVYKGLREGGSVGIFPEGGSHDRADLLPLKAGVSMMALGAMAENPGLNVQILPVGLSYFHPHKFRSRAVVEFGSPMSIPAEYVEGFQKGGQEKTQAINNLLNLIYDGLKSVTVRAPDYETLMLVQAARRLYNPPDVHLSLSTVVEMNRRFLTGWLKYKDDVRVKALVAKVLEYNRRLNYLGLRDHQVENADRAAWKSLAILLYRIGLISVWTLVALPGVVLNAPMFIAAKVVSKKKAKQALAASTVKLEGRDVLATWKVLVSLGIAPILYSFYLGLVIFWTFRYSLPLEYKIAAPLATIFALPAIGYSALKVGEVGMDLYKSLPPLFISLLPGNHQSIQTLREMRRNLAQQIREVVDELGPTVFDDFESLRAIPSSVYNNPKYRPTYGVGSNNVLSHPLGWLDEKLFGWSQDGKDRKLDSGDTTPQSEISEEGSQNQDGETPKNDYEEIVRVLRRNSIGAADQAAASGMKLSDTDSLKQRRQKQQQ